MINTVSRGDAQEILTPEFRAGLEDFLKTRSSDIYGVMNGLDTEHWEPDTDPSIYVNHKIDEFKKREKNKTALLSEFDLKADIERPLLTMINRMDH